MLTYLEKIEVMNYYTTKMKQTTGRGLKSIYPNC